MAEQHRHCFYCGLVINTWGPCESSANPALSLTCGGKPHVYSGYCQNEDCEIGEGFVESLHPHYHHEGMNECIHCEGYCKCGVAAPTAPPAQPAGNKLKPNFIKIDIPGYSSVYIKPDKIVVMYELIFNKQTKIQFQNTDDYVIIHLPINKVYEQIENYYRQMGEST